MAKEQPAISEKLARQDRVIALLRNGVSPPEACKEVGVAWRTFDNWRLRQAGDFNARYKAAIQAGKRRDAGETFPDFLTFREEHFAYQDKRKGKHPLTGEWWVSRCRNSWYQIDANDKLESTTRLIMVMPPGHIKTTLFGIERSTYDIMRDRDIRITVIQKNEGEARKLISSVQLRLSDHDFYHEMAELLVKQGDVPISCPLCTYEGDMPFKPSQRGEVGTRWGAEMFTVQGRRSGEKDSTMEAKGVGSQIQGVRADRIVLDDVQDPSVALKSQQDSIDKLEWYRSVIEGRVADWQQIVVLANFFTPDDFAHLLIEAEPTYPVINYPAIIDVDKKKVMCPEFWTFEGLMKKRAQVGEHFWHYTWMQEEGSFDQQTFKRDVLEAARDDTLKLGEIPFNIDDVFLGVDPATAASGYCAIVAWGLDRDTQQRCLIDIFNEKGMRNWDNVTEQVLEFVRAYGPRKVVVEGNNTQKGFINSEILQRGVRSLGSRIEIYQTVTGVGARATQTNFDITTIGGLFDAGLITLPYGGPQKERDRIDAYISQLCQWRTDERTGNSIKHLTRDMVMATLFAESEAFLIANKPKRLINYTPKIPAWAGNGQGGFAWQRKDPPRRRPASELFV